MTLRSCQSHYSPAEGTSSAWTSRNWTKWWTMKEHYTCPFINLGTRVLQWWLSGRGGQRQMKDSEWLTAATLTSESMKGNLLSLSWTPDTMTSLKAPWARPRGDRAFALMFLFIVQFVRKEQYNLLDTPVILPFFLFLVEENQDWWDPGPPFALQLTVSLKDVNSKGIDFFGLH